MRTAQMKVSLRPYDRDFLAWAAARMGEPPATLAARLLAERLTDLLADKDVRFQYRLHLAGGGAAAGAGEISGLEQRAGQAALAAALRLEVQR